MMTPKELLKDGHRVKLRKKVILYSLPSVDYMYLETGNLYVYLRHYHEDLKHMSNTEFDIMAIYDTEGNLVWEREEIEEVEFSEVAKIILRELDDRYKWIAKDDDGTVCAFKIKPITEDGERIWYDDDLGELTELDFNCISSAISTDKPYKISDIIGG